MLTILYGSVFRSEFYCFGIRIQKIVLNCLLRSGTNLMLLINLNIKKTKAKLPRFVIYAQAMFVAVVLLISWNLLAKAIFCTNGK